MTETPSTQANTQALKAAIQTLNHACDNADVDGHDGEAVFYLDALLMMADGLDADAAVDIAYGIKA